MGTETVRSNEFPKDASAAGHTENHGSRTQVSSGSSLKEGERENTEEAGMHTS